MTLLAAPFPPSSDELAAFLDRHAQLLQLERNAEEEQTRLLNSSCSPKLLEQRGLALGGLGLASISVGLGGKNLIELHRPLAYHTEQRLPTHTLRNGDPARIEPHISGISSAKGKGKQKEQDGDQAKAIEGVVYRVSSERVVVAADGAKEVDLPERLRLLKLANSVTFDRMDRTIKHLRRIVAPDPTSTSPTPPNMPLINALLGRSPPSWLAHVPPTISTLAAPSSDDPPSAPGDDVDWIGSALNDSQKEAIRFCLKAEQVACIHGPPGTGKTHTLIELILQLLSRPASSASSLPPKILVTTPSNLALDNLLLRLHTLARSGPPYSTLLPPGSVLRLGHPTRVHRDLVGETLDWRAANGDEGELVRDVKNEIEGNMKDLGRKKGEKGWLKGKERGKKWDEVKELRKEYRQREGRVVTSVVGRAQVVLATCHSAGSRQLNNVEFDIAIVDEATQAIEAVCWVPILKAKRLILAGDPQQLPPTILSKDDKTAKDPRAAASTVAKDQVHGENNPTETMDNADDLSLHIDSKLSLGHKRPSKLKPPRTLETTLFDRLSTLYGPGVKRILKVQYRMNSLIADFPNKTLYDSELISDNSVKDRTLADLPSVIERLADEAALDDREREEAGEVIGETVIFWETEGCEFYERAEAEEETLGKKGGGRGIGEGSKLNENEAVVVEKWARKLVKYGVPPHEVAIITPYQAQVSHISSLLHADYPEMTIGTVDGLQGQEREAVILSLVRSNPTGEVGFLGEYRRLNVAMTRARRQLCVVGDSSTVGKGSKYLKDWMSWLEDKADVRWAGDDNA